ncbi:ABC transporter substrate binding protein [Candidatus Venteria ishoeyi]|uniref:ABC transporter substrate-binding protein n=1 Tax=Candidatus Venteria ishoeyi TaxID=1899563 RepID=UPI0025A550C0|nr:ABC transporter substrate binding protein [Candidatus Venteria ishoeyi]MDM8545612.1 ABC transporter substrate binding protein [Candidatus Venteria ishoeyi]
MEHQKIFTLSRILSLILLALLIVTAITFNINKPRIMILHSYHPDYAWTRDVNVGLNRIAKTWNNYSLIWHHMDTKKHNDPEWLTKAGLVARRAIDKWEPHVLIAVDDYAQKLAAKFYVDDPSISIVFAGVNGSIEPYGYVGAKNVTGILERRQLGALKETLLSLKQVGKVDTLESKKNLRLFYLMDPSVSVKRNQKAIEEYAWKPLQYAGSKVAKNYEQWQQIIQELEGQVDYVVLANYRKLPRSSTDKTFVPPKEVMSWTEQNAIMPVIGLNVFNVEDGAMLSVGVSPYEQGEVAAKMAEKIINKKIQANQIPVESSQQFIIAMRESDVNKRQLIVPSIYEAFSRATATYYD